MTTRRFPNATPWPFPMAVSTCTRRTIFAASLGASGNDWINTWTGSKIFGLVKWENLHRKSMGVFYIFLPSNLMGMIRGLRFQLSITFHNFPFIQVCEKTIMLTYSKSMTYIDTLEIFHRFSICFEHFGMTLIPTSKHTLML